jgi:exo-1,4-beta-D-glucosaminidase
LWTYANPKHYYERKNDGAWGFAQSGGIGGIIVPFESVRRMIPEGERWPLWTEAMSFHTVTQGGHFFDTVVQMVEARYGKPDSIESFCMKGQVLNYECARGMFEAYGRNKYSATGITTWKYDVAWPAFMTWAYVDWYLIANGAYYGAQEACEAVHVQYSYDDDSVCVVTGLYRDFPNLTVTAKVYNLDMKERYSRTERVNLPADGVVRAFTIKWPRRLSKSHFLQLTLDDAQGNRLSDNFYWLSTTPDVRGKINMSWRDFSVSPESIADHTDLNSLPTVALDASAAFQQAADETVAQVKLKNPSEHLAFFVRLAVINDKDGSEIGPTFWQTNCVSLLPGEERTVAGRFYTQHLDGAKPQVRIEGWNVTPAQIGAQ